MAQDSYAQRKTEAVLAGLGQRLVTLSDINKDALLSGAAQLTHSSESRGRADAILSRLRELNPDVARQFHPKQDALSDVRLRMICSALEPAAKATGDNVSSYIAVSYCWHYKQWPLPSPVSKLCEGWEISKPMMEEVMALCQGPNEGVWLDKLCINQEDSADVAAHIGVMDAIYRSARRIAILLEDVLLDKDEEEVALAFAGFYEDLCRKVKERGLEGEEKSRFIDGYFPDRTAELLGSDRAHIFAAIKPFAKKILGARWFGRAWCAHESRTAKHQKVNNPLFFCFGSKGQVPQFVFRFIQYLGLYLCDSEPPDPIAGPVFMERLNDPLPKTLRQSWWRIQRLMPSPSDGVSAMQHVVNVLSFGCLKKGDLLSIALNTAEIPLYFEGEEVRSVEEVIWRFTLLVLASGDLVPLVTVGELLRIPTPGGSIISWALNPAQGVLDEPLPNPLPQSITAITQEYIELDLLVFESLPKTASPESQEKAARLIADHNLASYNDALLAKLPEFTQSTIRAVSAEMTRLEPDNRLLHTFHHQYLSLALDNGLTWILNFPAAMAQNSASPWMHGTLGYKTNPALTPAAHDLLALFQPNSTTTTNPTESHATLIQNLTTSLTTLLDPRLLLLTPNPRTLPLPFSLGTAALTPSTSNRSYVAVPSCLAHLPGWYDRAWVVEPFDPCCTAPERIEDLLPREDLRVAKQGEGEVVEKVEDVVPVLGSDYADRRAERDDARGTWRVRRRQVLFGCFGGVWEAEGSGLLRGDGTGVTKGVLAGGEGLVLLRRQRVYGCEDYPWGEIHEAMRRVLGTGVEGH